MKHKKGVNKTFYVLVACVLILDVASKWLIQRLIAPPGVDSLRCPLKPFLVFQIQGIDFFITHAVNYGAAWGLFANYSQVLFFCRLLMLSLMIFYAHRYVKSDRLNQFLALLIAGALGNILDTIFYGHVVDMFQFIFWGWEYPVFNVADCAITIGVLGILINSWKHDPKAN